MSSRQKISWDEIFFPSASRQSAQATLMILWRGKFFIVGALILALLLGSIGIVLYGPRYTSEAILQPNFELQTTTDKASGQLSVPVDAMALIDGAARLIRSRATAAAVVDRFHLDRDPYFAHEPIGWRILSSLRAWFGLTMTRPSARDLAVNMLMRKIIVAVEPRSYVISIDVTTNDPQQSALLANSIAEEYLDSEKVKRLATARATSERTLGQLASVYGVRHPNYALEQARIAQLQELEKAVIADRSLDEARAFLSNEPFVPAEAVLVPSGPNVLLVLGLTTGLALTLGVWLTLRLGWIRAAQPPMISAQGAGTAATATDVTLSAFFSAVGPRLRWRLIAVALAVIGGLVFLWSVIHASFPLLRSLAA